MKEEIPGGEMLPHERQDPPLAQYPIRMSGPFSRAGLAQVIREWFFF